ncbi:hypothetical protein HU200_031566 [Digitaria exilis]|uniref:Brix domain-containing protein n=1 Tax=Digitaria exilis TaxID=1010633 RepID=A0A835BPI6_9POAL|nr:hypothetical protein HU200_031566 [Digitaria exilis]
MRQPRSGPGKRRGHGPRIPATTLRKQQAALANVDQITGAKIPKSFVFSRGKLPPPRSATSSMTSARSCSPTLLSTSSWNNWQEKKRNNLKDFVNVAGPLGVTHFMILSNPKSLPHLRFSNSPQGPTFTLKIEEYALAADIANSQKRPRCPPGIFQNSPLVVLSGFSGLGNPFESLVEYFEHMVPAVDPSTVKLAACQRILLLKYDKEKEVIDFRHYSIKLQPVGVSRKIRKLMQNNQVPDLRDLKDVSDYVTK